MDYTKHPIEKINKDNYKDNICDAGLFTTVSFTPTIPNYWEGNLDDRAREIFSYKDMYCQYRASYEEAIARNADQDTIDKKGISYATACDYLDNRKKTFPLGWNKAMGKITNCGNGFLPYCKTKSETDVETVEVTTAPTMQKR